MRVADLFCGGGGSSCGLALVPGVEIVLAVDHDERALRVYRENHPGHAALCMDISDVSSMVQELRRRDIQVICGSPPCQDFSLAGNRVEGERAELTSKFADIVTQCRPEICIMENVPAVVESRAFNEFKQKMLADGYHMALMILNAAQFGTPQHRKRAFVVSSRGSLRALQRMLEAVPATRLAAPVAPTDAIPRFPATFTLPPRNANTPGVFAGSKPSCTLRCNCASKLNALAYQAHTRDAGPIETASTLPLWQLGMLSGFPEEYKWPTLRSHGGRVIGNAVCPPVMKWVAETYLNLHEARTGDEAAEFIADPPVARPVCMVFCPGALSEARVLTIKSEHAKCDVLLGEYIVARRVVLPSAEGALAGEDEAHVLTTYVRCHPPDLRLTHKTAILIEDSEQVYTNRHARGPTTTRERTRLLLQLSDDARTPEDMQRAAAERGVDIFRMTPLVLRYTQGTDPLTDLLALAMTNGHMRSGWTLEVRERLVTTFINDDLYWYVPAKDSRTRRYRSTSELVRAGVLPHPSTQSSGAP